MGRLTVGAGKAWQRVSPYLGQNPLLTKGPVWTAAGDRETVSRIVYRNNKSRWELYDSVGGDRLGEQGTNNSWTLPTGTYRWHKYPSKDRSIAALVNTATQRTAISDAVDDPWWFTIADGPTLAYRNIGPLGRVTTREGNTVTREVMMSHETVFMTLRWLPPVRRSYSRGGLWLGETLVHPGLPATADPMLITVFLLPSFIGACTVVFRGVA